MTDDATPFHGVAATVAILRDGVAGLEVLLLERPRSRGSFAGAWVFPGGAIDPEDWVDGDRPDGHGPESHEAEEQSARRAAVRETREETGLGVAESDMEPVAVWSPPAEAPKRMRTWFYYAEASPEVATSEPALAADELVDFRWIAPSAALAAHGNGQLELVPPTWVTLRGLAVSSTVADAMRWARASPVMHRHTRLASSGKTLLWEGDVAHADDALLETQGARHRLDIGDLPWVYQHTTPDREDEPPANRA